MSQTETECPPLADRITKSLLGYGVLAGPFYVVVAAVQVLTRDGYDPTRHVVSQLANGDFGWIQTVNFAVTGLATIAAAVGIGRALAPGGNARWATVLLSGYGLGLVVSAVLRADPSDGFPPGTPPGVGAMSWHGVGHFVAGAIGFVCFISAGFVIAAAFARNGFRGWAWFSRVVAVAFGAAFVVLASGSAGATGIILFTVAVVLSWVWLSAVSVRLYRQVGAA